MALKISENFWMNWALCGQLVKSSRMRLVERFFLMCSMRKMVLSSL